MDRLPEKKANKTVPNPTKFVFEQT